MQIAFVVWPLEKVSPRFMWGVDHASITWLTISLMYHFIGCAIVLMAQYICVFFTIDCFDRCYSKYEIDTEESYATYLRYGCNQSTKSNSKEYAILMNDMEDEQETT
jgi:hypothetical protein